MKIKRKLKVIGLAAAVGAITAYLFDPIAGPARRRRIVNSIERRSDDARDVVQNVERVKEAINPDESASADAEGQSPASRPSTNGETAEPDGTPAVAGVTDVAPESESRA